MTSKNWTWTITLTYTCSMCHAVFPLTKQYVSKKSKGINTSYGTYCSGQCKRLANLRRGKISVEEKCQYVHTRMMNNLNGIWINNCTINYSKGS